MFHTLAVHRGHPTSLAMIAALLLSAGTLARAQQPTPESEAERRARLERRGAGISVGIWKVRGLEERSGVEEKQSPAFEGFFAKGLDRHLVMETTLGLWVRTQEAQSSGGLGGPSTETIRSYVIPQFTSLKLYPVSEPADNFQPFLGAGAGFAIAIDDRETDGGGLLGGVAGDGTAFVPGFGIKGQLGTELRGKAFGISIAGKYQWIRFFQEVGGERTLQGLGADVGFVYRFQY